MDLLDRIQGFINQKKEVIQDGEDTIEIVDTGYEKVLKFNGIVYSRIKEGGLYTHQYWDFFLPLAHLYDNPKILMIGLGGGTVVFQLNKTLPGRFSIDVVEVSEKMQQAAKHFLPSEANATVIIAEGASYLRENKKQYDMIILDAFIDAEIPLQFFTAEFIQNAYQSLSEKGILAINYLPQMSGGGSLDDYARKLGLKFKVYKVNISSIALNSILLCSKGLNKEQIIAEMAKRFPVSRENQYILKEYNVMREAP